MKLTPHFSLEELIASEVAARKHIDNHPPQDVLANIIALAEGLEQVRTALGGHPILVTSGYRSPQLNEAVGGSKNSAHMQGLAADFICPHVGTPFDICMAIVASDIQFDQLIHEYGRWVHIAFAAPGKQPRGECLSIFNAKEGYLPAIVRA